MDANQNSQTDQSGAPSFRLEHSIHDILMRGEKKPMPAHISEDLRLPDPVFPQRPAGDDYTEKQFNKLNAIRGLKGWATPYFKSRWHSKELRPIIAYLFSEFKCNVDCHYCWSYNNKVKGMTEATARRSIDWLHSIGCRV